MIRELSEDEAVALERAAEEAEKAGDYAHAENLRGRALWVRRASRERKAGVMGWPMIDDISRERGTPMKCANCGQDKYAHPVSSELGCAEFRPMSERELRERIAAVLARYAFCAYGDLSGSPAVCEPYDDAKFPDDFTANEAACFRALADHVLAEIGLATVSPEGGRVRQ